MKSLKSYTLAILEEHKRKPYGYNDHIILAGHENNADFRVLHQEKKSVKLNHLEQLEINK